MAVANRSSNRIAIRALDCSPDNTILDLGCGSGTALRVLAAMAGQGRILGLDHSGIMLAQALRHNRQTVRHGRVHLVRGRIDALPWRDDTVDKILAVHVVYFAGVAGVREAWRVLRPGGRIVILATDRSAMTRWKFTQSSTHELFDVRGLSDLLVRGGFAANEISVKADQARIWRPRFAGGRDQVTAAAAGIQEAAACSRSTSAAMRWASIAHGMPQ